MKQIEFDDITQRLTKWFGKNMKPEQINIMHEKLKHIPAAAYRKIVDQLIETSKFFPTINDIKAQYREHFESDYPDESRPHYTHDESDDQYYCRVTIDRLWEGLRIFKRDRSQFSTWAARNHINQDDVERIEAKANYQTHKAQPAAEKLAERVAEEVPF